MRSAAIPLRALFKLAMLGTCGALAILRGGCCLRTTRDEGEEDVVAGVGVDVCEKDEHNA